MSLPSMDRRARLWPLGLVIAASLLLAGCGSAAAPQPSLVRESAAGSPVNPPAQPGKAPAATSAPAAAAAPGGAQSADNAFAEKPAQPNAGQPQAPDARKIVYTANLSIVVIDPDQTIAQVTQLVEGAGGYIANQQAQLIGEQRQAHLTLRVPVGQFEPIMANLRQLAKRIPTDNLNTDDITGQYSDLQAQLKNLEATEVELRALLTEVRQKPNAKPDDILQVYQRLNEIRGQIEQTKGRIQMYDQLTALATINLEIMPDAVTKPVVTAGWQPLATARAALASLITALQTLVDALIWLALYIVPVLLLIAIPFVVVIFLIRRVRRRSAAQA